MLHYALPRGVTSPARRLISYSPRLRQVGEEPLNRDEVVALRAELRSPQVAAEIRERVQSPEVRGHSRRGLRAGAMGGGLGW